MKTTLQLPDNLKVSLNQYYAGMHWTKRKKLKDDYLIWFSQYKNKFQKFTSQVEIQFDFHFRKQPLDCDNCVAIAKMVTDCMIKADIIQDDSYKHIVKVAYTSKKTKDENYIDVEIKESIGE